MEAASYTLLILRQCTEVAWHDGIALNAWFLGIYAVLVPVVCVISNGSAEIVRLMVRNPDVPRPYNVSLVIVRTEKGKELFSAVSKELVLKSVSYEDGVRSNKSEYQSYPKPPKREAFFKDMRQMPFEKLSQKYLKVPLKVKIKKVIKAVLIKTPYGKNRWGGYSN